MVDNQLPTDTEISVNELPPDMPVAPKSGSKLSFFNKRTLLVAMIAFVAALAVATLFFVVNNSSKQNRALKAVEEARLAYKKGDFKETKQKLYESLQAAPNNPNAVAAMIKTVASEGNQAGTEKEAFENAKPYVEYALKNQPDEPDVLISIGYLNETNGNYEKALEFYEKALRIDPKNDDALFHKGHVLQFLSRPEEAKIAYDEAYKFNPQNPQVLMAKASFLLAEGKAEEAFKLYKTAAEVKDMSNLLKAEAYAGASIIRRGQILHMKEAIELSTNAVKTADSYSPGLAAHGFNLAINGKPEEGKNYLMRAITANPRISANYAQLGQVFRASKQYQDAIKTQNEAIKRVNQDNTILGDSLKRTIRAEYTYDLAKTYSISGGNPDTLILLQQATLSDTRLKANIKEDYEKRGIFKELSSEQAFLVLIQI